MSLSLFLERHDWKMVAGIQVKSRKDRAELAMIICIQLVNFIPSTQAGGVCTTHGGQWHKCWEKLGKAGKSASPIELMLH